MTRSFRNTFLFLLIAAVAVAQPNITGLSKSTAARSSRVLILGAGFGAEQGGSRIEIAGTAALLTRWSDTLISAYVPETASIGSTNVRVITVGGSSNPFPLNVVMRQAQAGHIKWRFEADADYIQSRPVVAGDGTVYTQDVYGHLYALSPDGALKWIFNAPGVGYGSVGLGADGTIYLGNQASIFAVAPNGKLRWQFDQNPGALVLFGPNVGPDGNIYAVAVEGMGVLSFTPQGNLRWAAPEHIDDRLRVFFQEVTFGPAAQQQLYFHGNGHFRSFGLDGSEIFTFSEFLGTSQADAQPSVSPDGSVYSNLFNALGFGLMLGKFDNKGNQLWHIFDRFPDSTNVLTSAEAGPDGVVYDGRNLMNLYAINPDSSVRWKYTDTGLFFYNTVSPANDIVLLGGVVTYGQPGFLEAVSTGGIALWKEIFPIENGLNIVPMSRAGFTPDGQTAYVGMSVPGQGVDAYTYLYSMQTGGGGVVSLASLTLNPTTVKGGVSSQGTVTLSGPAPAGGAVVTLTSNRKAVAKVPASITVPPGATTATFTVNTKGVLVKKIAKISASYAGVTKAAKLTLVP